MAHDRPCLQVHEYPSAPGGALLFRSHDLHEGVPIASGGGKRLKASFFFRASRPKPGQRKRKHAPKAALTAGEKKLEAALTAGEMELIDALAAAET